jgi:hypothetical protein
MSYRPKALGAKLPTGAVNANPSCPASACARQRGQFACASASNTLAARSRLRGSSPLP